MLGWLRFGIECAVRVSGLEEPVPRSRHTPFDLPSEDHRVEVLAVGRYFAGISMWQLKPAS
jgi:hypothetical protein